MNYTLLIFSIINPKKMSFRYFVSDKDWYHELHTKISYNMHSIAEMETTILMFGLKEISFNEIKDYTYVRTMDIAVYDEFHTYNEYNTFHYILDHEEEDYDNIFYGKEDFSGFKTSKTFLVNDLVKPIEKKFDGIYNKLNKDVYLVPTGCSMDEEFALYYIAFSKEEDADLFVSLYKVGEIAPYIFLNSDYDFAINNTALLKDIKIITLDELPNILKTKNVILKQEIFAGIDIYN